MDYTDAILWFISWPILIYISYRFVMINLRHHAKMERLEMLEEKFGNRCKNEDKLLKVN